jgi:hypothetical protein
MKRMGADPLQRAGLFRAGRSEPDISCTVATGAAMTVVENERIAPRFRMFRQLPVGAFSEAVE